MAVWDRIFSRKKKLEDINMDELRKERIRLEREEKKMADKVEDLERRKQQLFLQGKDESSQRQQRILATKIKELDVQAKNLDRNLQFISKQLRLVNAFEQIKEQQKLFQRMGISSIISNLDIQTLENYVEQASVEGQFQVDKFGELIGILEDSDKVVGAIEEDEDVAAIMRAMQEAKQDELLSPEEGEGEDLRQLDEILGAEKSDG